MSNGLKRFKAKRGTTGTTTAQRLERALHGGALLGELLGQRFGIDLLVFVQACGFGDLREPGSEEKASFGCVRARWWDIDF